MYSDIIYDCYCNKNFYSSYIIKTMVAEITMVIILGLTTLLGTLFFNLRNIKKCSACGCSCEQEINNQRDDNQVSNPVEMIQQNMERNNDRNYARPTALWNNNLSIPEERFKRSSSNKSMPTLQLESRDL